MRDEIWGVVCLVIGGLGIGYAIASKEKTNRLCKSIDRSFKDLEKNMEVTVPEAIVEKAMKDAAENEVYRAIQTTSAQVREDIKKKMDAEIKSSINAAYSDTKSLVSDELAKKASDIDINRLRTDVTNEAKEAVLKKLDYNLEEILSDFKDNLGKISKIYGSVADSLRGRSDSTSGLTFKLV